MNVVSDARYALRSLARTPGFTAVAVLTLALGVGANTAIFSVIEAALLRPLPFPDANRLVLLWETDIKASRDQVPFSYPDFADVTARTRSFDSASALVLARVTVGGKPQPEQIQGAYVTASFFPTLAIQPSIGHGFTPADDRHGAPAVALISQSLWQRRFAGDASIVGRVITIDNRPFEVAGVLPPEFRFANLGRDTELWLPLSQDPFSARRYARAVRSMGVIARLRASVDLASAQADLNEVARGLRAAHPDDDATLGLRVIDLREQAVRNLRPVLLLLDGAVIFVLLIACANVANLLAARATGRQRELAVRTALGASRSRLISQWLTESLVLGLLGGAAGLLLALWGIDLLSRAPLDRGHSLSPYNLQIDHLGLNPTVFAFTCGLSILTGLVVGLLPAWQSLRETPNAGLKDGAQGGTAGPRRQRALGTLVAVQMALSVTLVAGALLTVTSFSRLLNVDPGFTATDVLTFDVNLPDARYSDAPRTQAFFDTLIDRVQQLPGVTRAGAIEYMPLTGADSTTTALAGDRPMPARGQETRVSSASVTPGYFEAMGVPVRRGRAFTARDREGSPRVALVNETLARQLWPGDTAIGKRVALAFESLRFFRDRAPELDPSIGMREVVGVVADVKHNGLEGAAPAEIYVPFAQRPVRDMTVVIGARADPTTLVAAARRVVSGLDPEQPLGSIRTLEQIVDASVARPRFDSAVVGAFALVALLLSAVGIYGVLAYVASERTRETGVRLALGAEPGDILRLMVTRGLRFAGLGVAVGLIGAAGVSVALARTLFGVSAAEPVVYAGSGVMVLVVALGACYVPARRAARLDPVTALRHE